jgi:hypothetical protein
MLSSFVIAVAGTGRVFLPSIFGGRGHIWLEKERLKPQGKRLKIGGLRNIETVLFEC